MNEKQIRAAVVALLVAAALSPPTAHAARIKCWTNDQGVRECGNTVPPKYSQQGHRELNTQGITVQTQERAKSKEEIAEEERTAREAAEREAEAERVARAAAARDRVLLDTFTTEEDLVLAHQGRLAAIDSRIKHTRQLVTGLENELDGLQQEAAKQERSGQAVEPRLTTDITKVEGRISENQRFIDERHQEKRDLDRQFQDDLARYRQLKSARN